MQRNLLHYQRVLFLRKKKGYSYGEIREEVPVAKSTLSLWLRDIEISVKQRKSIEERRLDKLQKCWGTYSLGEWNRQKRQKEITKIRNQARKEVGPLTGDAFFIAGVMLYWAEGSKSGKEVRVSNSDSLFIKIMMRWLRECCEVPEKYFRASIHYHEGQNELAIRKHWSRVTGIPLRHFYRSFCKPPGTGHRKHVLQHGTMQIRLLKSADLYHKIVGWREGLIQGIISGTQ